MTTGSAADRIRASASEAVAAGRMPDGATRLLAIGWATVELDRAVVELAGVLAAPPIHAVASIALGAHCRIASFPLEDGTDLGLAILEPSSEGRLAAALARWDEGPLVAWYAVTTLEGSTQVHPGPFGPERLVAGDPLTGPHRLVVVTGPGTIPP